MEVIEDNANSRFVIRFVGTLGIPGNMADLKLTIEEIKWRIWQSNMNISTIHGLISAH